MRKSIESESISDIVCFGYMHKWCKESEVRELEARLAEAVELLEAIEDRRTNATFYTDIKGSFYEVTEMASNFLTTLGQEKEKSDEV